MENAFGILYLVAVGVLEILIIRDMLKFPADTWQGVGRSRGMWIAGTVLGVFCCFTGGLGVGLAYAIMVRPALMRSSTPGQVRETTGRDSTVSRPSRPSVPARAQRPDVEAWLARLSGPERRALAANDVVTGNLDVPDEEKLWALIPATLIGRSSDVPGVLYVSTHRLYFLAEPFDADLLFSSWPGGIGVEFSEIGGALRIGVTLRDASEILSGTEMKAILSRHKPERVEFVLGVPGGPNSINEYREAIERFLALP